ncbi:hypothetical protein [Actinoplanes sp. NPDC049118]|uniref:hypothetical protein n=1 Tax=Actinoplanes sp. NPDC049118 TaxID=3155769 RepID=UPI0033C7A537
MLPDLIARTARFRHAESGIGQLRHDPVPDPVGSERRRQAAAPLVVGDVPPARPQLGDLVETGR